jgi:hypothetical protein
MHVDEARRERETGAVDRRERIAFAAVADDRDALVDDCDIGRKRAAPAPVVDACVLENRV